MSYEKVVSILTTQHVDFDAVGRKLAQEFPIIFTALVENGGNWKAKVKCAVNEIGVGRISAVKLVREHTGWGLRESKDWVDAEFPVFPGSGAAQHQYTDYSAIPHQLRAA